MSPVATTRLAVPSSKSPETTSTAPTGEDANTAADVRDTVFAVVEHRSYSSDADEHGARIVQARVFGRDEQIELLLKPGHADVTYHPNDLVIAEGVRRTQADGSLVFEAELTVRVQAPLSYSPEMPSTNGPVTGPAV